jgi:hypothetical protein
MRRSQTAITIACQLCMGLAVLLAAHRVFGQVSPAEIPTPKLKAAEQKYLPQLQSLHKAISDANFPFPFVLTRYVTANPERPGLDSRGLEFVDFQGQTVLKTSGIYKAAYDADRLTQNERAARTFREVIVPILRLIPQQLPPDVGCDAIGFEIVYHTRGPKKSFEYEGKEILVVVLNRADAFALPNQADDQQRQTILNRSAVYVNAKEFGLALSDRNPLDLDALGRSTPVAPQEAPTGRVVESARPLVASPGEQAAPSEASVHVEPGEKALPAITATPLPPAASPASAVPVADSKPVPTPADAERLQSQFQSQLDALLKESGAKFHLVNYAPPSFSVYHDKLVLQLTLRNPMAFERSTSSIYKRAAQSFDLFLAPEVKGLMQKLPADTEFDALDFSILNRLGAEKNSSEAVEFICPLKLVRSFVNDEITSQDLINQSIVLVNGVRIALNLQLVE